MSADCPQYAVRYRLAGCGDAIFCDDGPFDYRCDAIDHRDWLFGHSPGVVECWIEKEGKPTGAVLKRKPGASA